MANAWDDPRIRKGLTAQLAARRARIAKGETPIGWKVGFGAPAALEKFGLAKPVTGYLMQKAMLRSGGAASFLGWMKPVAEPEIAVHMRKDLGANPDAATVAAAIASLTPAIELADFDPPPTAETLDTVLANDIFQRHVVLGVQSRSGSSTAGLVGHVKRRGVEAGRTDDPEALTGKLIDIVGHVASVLAAFGERLRAGDIIICGSILPPIFIDDDETELVYDLDPIGSVSVRFSRT
jgi:2-keto-4-pentenoate hydratase